MKDNKLTWLVMGGAHDVPSYGRAARCIEACNANASRSSPGRSGPGRSSPGRSSFDSGQVESGQIESGQIEPAQIESGRSSPGRSSPDTSSSSDLWPSSVRAQEGHLKREDKLILSSGF